MIRILHILHEMDNAGIGHFIMNYYRHIDRDKIQFDFLFLTEANGYFDDEIKKLGGRIYHTHLTKKNPLKSFMDIRKTVYDNQYSIVERHTGSAFGYYDLRAARSGGAKHLIMHSHNNKAGKVLIHNLSKLFLRIRCNNVACSKEAGEWLFGKHTEFRVIQNAIDCKKFMYNKVVRKNVRSELGIENKFVIGHVGRFDTQKNHGRILSIFCELTKTFDESVMICVGDGWLLDKYRKEAIDLGIQSKVRFLGARTDVNALLQSFDVFLLPSLYEGFPLVLVEAQAAGLPCIASNCVPMECNITGDVHFLELNESNRKWVEKLLEYKCYNRSENAERCIEAVRRSGFDINNAASELCAYYLNLIECKLK